MRILLKLVGVQPVVIARISTCKSEVKSRRRLNIFQLRARHAVFAHVLDAIDEHYCWCVAHDGLWLHLGPRSQRILLCSVMHVVVRAFRLVPVTADLLLLIIETMMTHFIFLKL